MSEPGPLRGLLPVGEHECVTCNRCACTFAKVHPACPRCSEEARNRAALLAEQQKNELLTGVLNGAEEAMKKLWRDLLDGADEDDDSGAHIGLARHARAKATGVGEAITILQATHAALAESPRATGQEPATVFQWLIERGQPEGQHACEWMKGRGRPDLRVA